MRAFTLPISAAAMALAACSDNPLPTELVSPATPANIETASLNNAAVYWNGVARGLVIKYAVSAPAAIRGYALVAVSQHNAAAAVQDRGVHAAISAASVVTLSYLFPAEQTALETQLQQYLATTGSGDPNEGENFGRAAGNRAVTFAQTDRFSAPWTGTVPTGPGIWFSATPPVGAMFGQAKTYFLRTANQFRPAQHPTFGSPEFQAALAEVREFSDTRTAQQDSLARFWNMPNGTYTPPGFWNEEASRLVAKYGSSERRAAHLYALMHMVAYDGLVASHEAKYTYWLLRPTMADPAITLPIPLPNFPSYPSNHAAVSGGMALIIGIEFPAERRRLALLADEAALSRVYGGIHYRFDGTAGLTLGRKIALWAKDHDVSLRTPFALN